MTLAPSYSPRQDALKYMCYSPYGNGLVRLQTAWKVNPFTNGLGGMKTGRTPGNGNMKTESLRGYEQA